MGLLDGKRAIVTGSGRGIGKAVAQLMAEHGASVVVNDLDEGVAEQTVQEIRASGGTAEAAVGSVTDPNFPARLIGTALDAFGGFDIIVNNAGYTWDGMIHKMSDEQWAAMLECHLTAPFRILREASKHWRELAKQEAERGRPVSRKVVNVSSTTGVAGNAGQVNYAAGKAGIVGVTKTLAKEWGRYNINVNAVAFGFIETRLTAPKDPARKEQVDGKEVTLGIPDNIREAAIRSIPLGRPGTPREAAGPVLFLASPLADYVTGVVLLVTGGSYM
ncbi:MAG: SDR family oxidoreductase [Candidatus Dadabacteria bacterium]|nr:MAG: SDR family oxidoreductase [Candidatus Dadabacteria bacterium]